MPRRGFRVTIGLMGATGDRAKTKGRHPVLVRDYIIKNATRTDRSRPADHCRNTESALPGRALFFMERRGATVRPRNGFGAVVRAVKHDGVVGNTELVELFE